jgi:hypothetical protein
MDSGLESTCEIDIRKSKRAVYRNDKRRLEVY